MTASQSQPLLTSAEAAARLGIKPETLYAYVSRGVLRRQRNRDGSWFDPLDIEALAARRRRRPPTTRGAAPGRPLMMLETDLALVEDGELYLRGQRASDLARTSTLEEVASWLWSADVDLLRSPLPPADLSTARNLLGALPPGATRTDQLQLIAVALGATDAWREETSPDALRRAGARFLTGVPQALDVSGPAPGAGIADLLWSALSPHPPDPPHVRALSAALVLLVDHDLAVSTLAARVAGSARASGYAVISAALGAFASPLHGLASVPAAALLRSVLAGESPERAIRGALAGTHTRLPGFGQALYPDGDARARTLLQLVTGLPGGPTALNAVHAVAEVVAQRTGLLPNIDLAIAALAVASDMDDGDGPLVFALGRTVGWIAHAIAEHAQPPLRLRPQGRYTGR